MSYRLKLLLFVLFGFAVLFVMSTGYSALNTLSRLDFVEAQRDQWQRPADIMRALDLRPGAVVAEVGCGSGYFIMRMSPQVGRKGRVIAEDIRWLPLAFLEARVLSGGDWNVHVVRGQTADPDLPPGQVDAVLIANTFHEFADPASILAQVRKALAPQGRLVIVDREIKPENIGITETGGHEIAPATVEAELRAAGFEVATLQDPFIKSDPDNETWWMMTAQAR